MKKIILILVLIFSIFIILNGGFTGKKNFKEAVIQRANYLHGGANKKIKISEGKDHLIYAIVPKKPVGKKDDLLRILEVRQRNRFENGKLTSTSDGSYNEIEYLCNSLNKNKLGIIFRLDVTGKENVGGWRSVDRKIQKTITVPLRGVTKKSGSLALSYIDENGSQVTLSTKQYISFELVKPDRILVRIKQ